MTACTQKGTASVSAMWYKKKELYTCMELQQNGDTSDQTKSGVEILLCLAPPESISLIKVTENSKVVFRAL